MSKAGGEMRAAEQPADEVSKQGRITPNDIVAEVIRMIHRRRYQPGERLREQELADHFQVSRGRIREALRILEAKGIIHFEPMRGASVARMTDAEVFESVEIAAALFGLAARKAAAGASAAEQEQIAAAAAALEDLAESDVAPRAFFRSTVDVGQLVVNAAHASRLDAILADVRAGWPNILGALGFTSKALRRRAARKWVRMAAAIAARDASAAEKLAIAVHQEVAEEVKRVGW
jgi:DNA-binding GntR family transcriptional regulator